MKKIFKTIFKIITFIIILSCMVITAIPALPSTFYSTMSGINMYNQKGIIKILATPYLYLHSLICKIMNTTPYKKNYI